jgi:hypothetical protein
LYTHRSEDQNEQQHEAHNQHPGVFAGKYVSTQKCDKMLTDLIHICGNIPMRKMLVCGLILLILAACQSAAPSDPNAIARKYLDDNGKQSVKITKVVPGNPKYHKADQLWCVETDETDAQGNTTLLAIWRTGSDWKTAPMTDGEYEWDLNGCPRS